MPATTVSQQIKNVQAQVDAWDAQIERYATQADMLDGYTKQAFLDELVHLKAQRDQFAEILSAMVPVTVISDDTNIANEDTEDFREPTDAELEDIRKSTFDDLDDESSEDDEEDDDDIVVNSHIDSAEYGFKELVQVYTNAKDSVFPKFLIK